LAAACSPRPQAARPADQHAIATRPPPQRLFIERAPRATRVLIHLDARGAARSAASQMMFGGTDDCDLDLERDVRTIDVAIAEPAEIRAEVTGTIGVEAAKCVVAPLVEGGLQLKVVPLAGGGVRIASPGAVEDGPGANDGLRERYREYAARA